ncbi:hypothetical protein [Flavobacterium beibuense]|uniref:Uncharacterized protein n=1 Tax=Flavobacterium beibuense F44-8 TaxID=1406840 RepID=A0A0A2LSF6_9FLAO|nr:hypothetical protein [Flavobacterium beibuense]KGO79120.1 hypothetical protein Q763_15590 [Flavobacterium beibuense F44-8]
MLFMGSIGNYIILIAIIAMLVFLIRGKVNRRKDERLQKLQQSEYKNRLMKEGNKIIVPFDNCKVTTSKSYTTKPASGGYRAQALNSLLDSRNAEVTTQHISSTVEVKVKINGSTKTLKSDSFPVGKETLLAKLYMQKEIEVYYDVHTRDYFINLHFLD